MTIKLLAAGDLHLGRRPGRLPEALSGRATDFAPSEAWRRLVDCAIDESVDALVLAGDVVESDRDYFEALPQLQRGVQRLADAGIATYAVAGNHDVAVLPRLIERVPHAQLLGAGGHWESVAIRDQADATPVVLWGWSFPRARHADSPLRDFPGARTGAVNIGLLHCDRDQLQSPYAPVSGQALTEAGMDAWLLGHIHQPDALSPRIPHGYLGTVTGLDAGEAGPRGPWRVDITDGVITRFEQRHLAPIQWTRLTIDLTDADTAHAIEDRLLTSLEATLEATTRQAGPGPDLHALQIAFTGASDWSEAAVAAALPDPEEVHASPSGHGAQWFIERWNLRTQPTIALDRLARRDDQPGLLARRLRLLARPDDDPERQALLQSARQAAETALGQGQWRQLPGASPDTDTIAEWLEQRGLAALRAMLAAERGECS
jgi:predicted phosphodiesterase